MAKRPPLNSSGIFFDSSNISDFKKWFKAGILGGATTNPLILQKDGVLNIPQHISQMIAVCGPNFPISIEIPDTTMSKNAMINLALKYHERFPENAVIKIPMDPLQPQKAFEVIYKLAQQSVRLNATIGLGMGQLVGAAEALRLSKAEGDNYISLFWGRRDEAKNQIVEELVKSGVKREEALEKVPDAPASLAMSLKYLENHNLPLRIIAGSIRSVDQIEKAFSLGADIVTISPKLISEWMYTQRGVETVNEFNKAYRDLKDEITLI